MPNPGPAPSLQARFTARVLKSTVRVIMSPRFGISSQRRLIDLLSLTVPAIRSAQSTTLTLNGIKTARLDSRRTAPGQIHDLPDQRAVSSADSGANAEAGSFALLYLHGGGFVIGSAWCYRALTSRLARWTGLPVFVPNYRLAPEHPHPAQLDDALACVAALDAQGWPADRLIVAGDSAGGNLSLALTQALLAKGQKAPRALALISPWADASAAGNEQADDAVIDPGWVDFLRPMIGPAELLKAPALSPAYGRFEQFPPTLIQSAAGEVLAPIVRDLVARMRAAQAPVSWTEAPGLWHDFQLHAGTVPEAAQALRQMSNFIVQHAQHSS